jgi:hypothetical protein
MHPLNFIHGTTMMKVFVPSKGTFLGYKQQKMEQHMANLKLVIEDGGKILSAILPRG